MPEPDPRHLRAAGSLPFDSDVEVGDSAPADTTAAPPRVLDLALVVAGGTVGTALRESVALLLPRLGGLPWATVVVNLTGAFLLGLLLEVLTRRGPDAGRRRTLRLLLGTGLLGGYTTYGALALETSQLGGGPGWALGYAGGTLVLGTVASLAGIAVGARAIGADVGGRR